MEDIELRMRCLEAAISRITGGSKKSPFPRRNAIELAEEYFEWVKTGKQLERPKYLSPSQQAALAQQQAVNDYFGSALYTGQMSVVSNG